MGPLTKPDNRKPDHVAQLALLLPGVELRLSAHRLVSVVGQPSLHVSRFSAGFSSWRLADLDECCRHQ
jgi:hypothetical protein